MADLVVSAKEGLLCVPGDFYIDPWLPVERAVITHAHADHARAGHAHYLTAAPGAAVLRSRLDEISLDALPYGKKIIHNGVTISLHPAGHVLARPRFAWNGAARYGSSPATTSVTPTMVLEIGFEGIARSSRHKSGIAVRFPRMRDDKKIDDADTLDTLQAMTRNHG